FRQKVGKSQCRRCSCDVQSSTCNIEIKLSTGRVRRPGEHRTSNLLEPLAVILIDAHKAADEVYVFLVGKGTVPARPGQLPGRFSMVRIVNEIMSDCASGTIWFSGVIQHRVITAHSRIR